MRHKIFSLILFLFVTLSFVSAIETTTTVKINTVPNCTLSAFFIEEDSASYSVIENIRKETGTNGETLLTLITGEEGFELSLNLRKDNETVYSKRFNETYSTGGFVEIDFYPKWYQPVNKTEIVAPVISENSTLNETEETTNETEIIINDTKNTIIIENDKEKLTALSVSEGSLTIKSNVLYYAGGIIVLAVLIILFFRWNKRRKNMSREPKPIRVVKLSEITQQMPKNDNNDDIKDQEAKIQNAKKMIQDAEQQLRTMRSPNYDRIEQAKKRLIEDEKELIRLRRENSQRY